MRHHSVRASKNGTKMALLTSDEGPMGGVTIDVATATPHAIESISTNHTESGLSHDDTANSSNGDHDDERWSAEAAEQSVNSKTDRLDTPYNAIDVNQKKTRLVSVDSGFGSFGPSELNVVAISSEVSTSVTYPVRVASTFDATPAKVRTEKQTAAVDSEVSQCERDDKLSPLSTFEQPRRLSDGGAGAQHAEMAREYRKNRTTTMVSEEPYTELDVRLINRNDGLKDVMCYLDDDGAPQVREKYPKRKSTLKQELKARNLGASLDSDSMRGIQKKSNWVSFSRLCKKFKESFLSKCQRYR